MLNKGCWVEQSGAFAIAWRGMRYGDQMTSFSPKIPRISQSIRV